MQTLILERDEGVVTVTFNRPEKKNAISTTMWRELVAVLDELEESAEDRVLILTGAGDAFTSGADLAPDELGSVPASEPRGRGGGLGAAVRSMRIVGRVALRLHELHLPTIAAVNGVAAGAGCNLALGCALITPPPPAPSSEAFPR